MKISELESKLKEFREKYEDVDISFGYADDEGNSYCGCNVEIEMDRIYDELNITVLSE